MQLAENMRGQVGTSGDNGDTSNDAGFSVPTCPDRSGDNWGQMGTWWYRCVTYSCRFLRLVPSVPIETPQVSGAAGGSPSIKDTRQDAYNCLPG